MLSCGFTQEEVTALGDVGDCGGLLLLLQPLSHRGEVCTRLNARDNPRQFPADPGVGAACRQCQLLLLPSTGTDAPPAWNLFHQGMRKAGSESLRKSVILGAVGRMELSGHTSSRIGAPGAWKWSLAALLVVALLCRPWEGPPRLGWVWANRRE